MTDAPSIPDVISRAKAEVCSCEHGRELQVALDQVDALATRLMAALRDVDDAELARRVARGNIQPGRV